MESGLYALYVLVYVTGSIFKMAERVESNSNNDAFSSLPSSVFIQRHNGGRR